MAKMRAVLCLSAPLLLVTPTPAEACSCAPPPPPKEAFSEADAVFRGRVVSVDKETPPGKSPHSGKAVARFEVLTGWKGVTEREVLVTTSAIPGLCGNKFQVGTEYIVYAYAPKEGEAKPDAPARLTTTLCSRTSEAASPMAREDLRWLKTREPQKRPSP